MERTEVGKVGVGGGEGVLRGVRSGGPGRRIQSTLTPDIPPLPLRLDK